MPVRANTRRKGGYPHATREPRVFFDRMADPTHKTDPDKDDVSMT